MAVALVGCGDSGLKEKVDEQSVMITDLKDDIKELKSAVDKLDVYITGSSGGMDINPVTGFPVGPDGGRGMPGLNPRTGLPMGGGGGGLPGGGLPGGGLPGGGLPGGVMPGGGVPGGAGGPGRFPGAGGGLPGAGRGSAVDPSTGLPRPASQNPESQTRSRR